MAASRWPLTTEKGLLSGLWTERSILTFPPASVCARWDTAIRGWVEAVSTQAAKLGHISNLFYTEPYAKVAHKLCVRTGMSNVMFGNSGAEANEAMIKLARKYSFDRYGKGRGTVITLRNSFHGRTITTLAATGQDKFHNYFFPFTEGFRYADANDLDSVEAGGRP